MEKSVLYLHPDFIPTKKEKFFSLYDVGSDKFISISHILYSIINLFYYGKGQDIMSILKSDEFENSSLSDKDILIIIQQLVDKNILITESNYHLYNQKSAGGIFNTQLTRLSEVLADRKNKYIFLGFPYELGISSEGGCKHGPFYIRDYSFGVFDYRQYIKELEEDTFIFTSFPDLTFNKLYISDCGNLNGTYPEKNGKEFEQLSNITDLILSKKKFPIILGGDHSIFHSEISGIKKNYKEFGVIQFDAHSDFGGSIESGNWKKYLNHGNFWSFSTENEEIKSIHQFGVRDYSKKYLHKKIHSYSTEKSINHFEEIIENIDKDIPYYITFDVDCLDVNFISSTGTPLAGGFTYREIIKFFTILTKELNIIGADFVEFGKGSKNESILVSQLILNLILLNERDGIQDV